MEHLIIHLICWAIREHGGLPGPIEVPVDLSGYRGSAADALRAVDEGYRFAVYWHHHGRMVRSAITKVRPGTPLPPGWTGGQDVTQRLLVSLGCPPLLVAHANVVSRPLRFPPPPIAVDSTRYTRTGGVGATFVMLVVALTGTVFAWAWQRDAHDADLAGSVVRGAAIGAFMIAPAFVVSAWIVGAHLRDGPFEGRRWWPMLGLLAGSPALLGALGARQAWQAELEGVAATFAALDIAGPDRAAGFAASKADEMAVPPPDRSRSWRGVANVHPYGVRRYGPGDKGVLVDWTRGAAGVAALSARLPADRRATAPEEVRWIAYLARRVDPEGLRWTNGQVTRVEWLNLRIVDVRSGRLVAKGTSWTVPPETGARPAAVAVSDEEALALVREAIATSYL